MQTNTTSAAAWHPDPSGQHEFRYWDGNTWTDAVSDGGTQSWAPLVPVAAPHNVHPAYGGLQPVQHAAPYPAGGYYAIVRRATNGMAVASMVLGILWIYWIGSILALIFGYVALGQMKRRDENGRGMAIAGVVLGWVGVGTLLLTIIVASASVH